MMASRNMRGFAAGLAFGVTLTGCVSEQRNRAEPPPLGTPEASTSAPAVARASSPEAAATSTDATSPKATLSSNAVRPLPTLPDASALGTTAPAASVIHPLQPMPIASDPLAHYFADIDRVQLGSTPEALESHCEHPTRTLEANEITTMCTQPRSLLPLVVATYCKQEGDDSLCWIANQSPNIGGSQADALFDILLGHVSALYGPPGYRQNGTAAWQHPGDVTTTLLNDGASVLLVRATAPGRETTEVAREFPEHVGELAFGATEKEGNSMCARARGTFFSSQVVSQHTPPISPEHPAFLCSEPRVNLPFAVKYIAGTLCDDKVCDILLSPKSSSDQVLAMLKAKYGEPHVVLDDSARCTPNSPRYNWFWTSAVGRRIRAVRLTTDCGPLLHYMSEDGWDLRNLQVQ